MRKEKVEERGNNTDFGGGTVMGRRDGSFV